MNERDEKIELLRSKITAAEASLTAATKAYKKTRQKRGADAFKRGWYFEDQMKKWTGVIERSKAELADLERPTA